MRNQVNSSDAISSSDSTDIAIPRAGCFWLILIFEIPSIICSFFILYHFLVSRSLRQALYNHVFIVIALINLVVELTDIVWTLKFYQSNTVWSVAPSFCIAWVYLNEGLHITITLLVAWATIERHILIFHNQWIATKKQIILIHALPLVITLGYGLGYNFIIIVFPPCQNTFDYTQVRCGDPLCFYDDQRASLWDVIIHDLIAAIIIIVFSLALLVRIVMKKRSMHRPMHWRKHRKMTIQLLSISFLYLIIHIPYMLLEFVHSCGVSEEFGAEFVLYGNFFAYFGNLLLPFVCAGSLPELAKKVRHIVLCWRCQARIRPLESSSMTQTAGRKATRLPIIVEK
ncbi:unnamed protein product [Rotaria magnacalcarata]|uniref:G-protein coupled receptors family 1 profile domain-containing protein n=1 Tax=Rotaria magnacalcarata TaxID=392030 RepID=A0A816ZSB5_9BILA|nr:unnamed protein product [Rotaria magnacalcarata]CAF2231674.1 unnamed protein product [Rotaria magnacalcarata]CAF4282218.1 unnamed protein product [Rotaria magnacalcarata]CAF4314625.1 unnamed protein product [Rotaria magnacalcarata]